MATPTIAERLDNIHEEVLSILMRTTPVSYTEARKQLFASYGFEVSADNLRVWHVRRVATRAVESTPPDVHCPIDDYAEAIKVWRGPDARFTWNTISRLLAADPPDGFAFNVSPQNLRAWWSRRLKRRQKGDLGQSGGFAVPTQQQARPTTTPSRNQSAEELRKRVDTMRAERAATERSKDAVLDALVKEPK